MRAKGRTLVWAAAAPVEKRVTECSGGVASGDTYCSTEPWCIATHVKLQSEGEAAVSRAVVGRKVS